MDPSDLMLNACSEESGSDMDAEASEEELASEVEAGSVMTPSDDDSRSSGSDIEVEMAVADVAKDSSEEDERNIIHRRPATAAGGPDAKVVRRRPAAMADVAKDSSEEDEGKIILRRPAAAEGGQDAEVVRRRPAARASKPHE
eukprot:16446726-Heterocapsa_arctica.AAC.1